MVRAVPLSRESLAVLPSGIARPNFAPDLVRPGIVHLGAADFTVRIWLATRMT